VERELRLRQDKNVASVSSPPCPRTQVRASYYGYQPSIKSQKEHFGVTR
jgi:hypothetical protein